MVGEEIVKELINAALKARQCAYVPYSNFPVGAAVLTGGGEIYTGCNVENASYGLTNCAERTAVFTAVAAGEGKLKAVAIAADTAKPTTPCGACRQVLAEFQIETVIMTNLQGDTLVMPLRELLPYAFHESDITGGKISG